MALDPRFRGDDTRTCPAAVIPAKAGILAELRGFAGSATAKQLVLLGSPREGLHYTACAEGTWAVEIFGGG